MSKSAEARVTDDELYVAASPRLLADLFHGMDSLKVHNVGDLTKEPRMVEGVDEWPTDATAFNPPTPLTIEAGRCS